MAVPKKKVSRSRRNMRRFASGNKLAKPAISTCPSCNEPKQPHSICRCGFYDGKAVLPAPKSQRRDQQAQA
jgi:large subunit ribosomal protein L32